MRRPFDLTAPPNQLRLRMRSQLRCALGGPLLLLLLLLLAVATRPAAAAFVTPIELDIPTRLYASCVKLTHESTGRALVASPT